MKTISYKELVKNENIILCNEICSQFDLELYCGNDYDEEDDYYYDIYQYYLIEEHFAEYLARATSEIVYYCNELNLYIWGVTHFGTPWAGVYLDIKEYKDMVTDDIYN